MSVIIHSHFCVLFAFTLYFGRVGEFFYSQAIFPIKKRQTDAVLPFSSTHKGSTQIDFVLRPIKVFKIRNCVWPYPSQILLEHTILSIFSILRKSTCCRLYYLLLFRTLIAFMSKNRYFIRTATLPIKVKSSVFPSFFQY